MKKRLLYIGNKLSAHGNTATAIEVLGPLLEKEGFAVKYASAKKNMIWRLFDMIVSTIRYRKADYVIIDTYSTLNFWYALVISQLCRLFKLKYIPILHGGNLPSRLDKNPKLCRMIFSHAYANVAPSGYLKNAFRSQGFRNVKYIPNTIEIKDFPFKIRENLRPKILWVRSFASIYNPEMAIRTLSEIQKKYPEAELCMVGPDKDGMVNRLKEMATGNKLNVTFTGKLSKEEWTNISENFDIFINTSHVDNTPYSIIEAASLGLLIVSTHVGGIPFLLTNRKTALLVSNNDNKGMAASILELLNNQEISQDLALNARNLALQFDWENVRKKWLEILI